MEIDNQNKVLYQKAVQSDFYTKKSQKIGDFFNGFLLALLISVTTSFIAGINGLPIIFYCSIIMLSMMCIYFFKKGRRFAAIGIISLGLIPVLISGSCLYSLNSANFSTMPQIP